MSATITLATPSRIKGGVWRHVAELASALRIAGWDVRLGLSAAAAPLHDAARALDLPVVEIGRSVRSGALWHVHLGDTFDLEGFRLLARRRRFGPSLLTEHLPHSNASDPALYAHVGRRPGAALAKRVFKRVEYGLCTRVITVSDDSHRFVADRYRPAPDRVRAIANGLDPASIEPTPLPAPGRLRVATVGSLIVQKGHDVLIDAAALAQRDWTVTIAGTGPHDDTLRARAAERAPGRVHFRGWTDDPGAIVRDAHLFVLPSRWESCPYVLLEAMAAARPVVATRVDGSEQLLGPAGVLVSPEDPAALAAAIDLLVDDWERLRAMAAAGRARVASFGLDRMVATTAALYDEVLADA